MSGENGPATTPRDGASPAVENKEHATESATVDAPSAAPAAEAKAAAEPEAPAAESDKAAEENATEQTEEKPDVEMTDDAAPAEPAPQAADASEAAEPEQAEQTEQAEQAEQAESAAAGADKSKSKRKSIGGGDTKGKKLNKKASKPRMLHLDAKPGDHFFVKLKGFPQWPVIICDEDMLPASLLKTRPVTAKRADGTYREDYADGGKKVADRTFPVMYLHTNEFGWVCNTDLIELDPSTVLDVKLDKMRKPLQAAHQLAAEQHPLSYYKEVLQNYQEELIEKEKAKAAKAATPKGKKSKAASQEDEDVEMEDAPDVETPAKDKKAKKRKAEDSAETPQRSDSVKKPKIKLTTSATPKAANGGAASTPKSGKAGESKSAKAKSKKAKEEGDKEVEKEAPAPKEPELSAEDKHARKKKEVLFLRHKLQKGLLTRDQEPKEEEMKLMSDYITKLEGFPDLEVSIIRATKINKVLKAILKLEHIPKEEEFKFKPRSQVLLDKWNKLLAVEGAPAAPAAEVNGTSKAPTQANGVKEKSEAAEPPKAKEETDEGAKSEPQDTKTKSEKEPEGEVKEAPKAATKPVEGSEAAEKPAAEQAKASEAGEAGEASS
ncbi:3bd56652-4e37-41c1-bed5-64768552086b [Thermothielavioides terrestris]|uniref:3bd56652-4e37-41c1-bed5-64768552086b n=1 Tax=Thermothielavioides terrestris TaxID=2587410 RepID=A0A446BA87_9PEZI|nr:3bd56652-4e37-41c1-bed5-64768552086b [Thermothielavioides terrestris]